MARLRGPLELATESAEETRGQRRRRREGGALPLRVGVRDALFPFVSHVTHVLSSLLSFHPALRTHNLTVPPSHNATFVFTNDSAYSNFSASVGEHRCWVLSNVEPTVGLTRLGKEWWPGASDGQPERCWEKPHRLLA